MISIVILVDSRCANRKGGRCLDFEPAPSSMPCRAAVDFLAFQISQHGPHLLIVWLQPEGVLQER